MSDITLDIADFHWVTQILDTMDSAYCFGSRV